MSANHQTSSVHTSGTDFRLLLPAVFAWVVAAALLGRAPGTMPCTSGWRARPS